jgi:hypothetical protein
MSSNSDFRQGALGSWGAALLEPYSDDPKSKGLMLTSPEKLEELVRKFWKEGWQTVGLDLRFSIYLNQLGTPGYPLYWRPGQSCCPRHLREDHPRRHECI